MKMGNKILETRIRMRIFTFPRSILLSAQVPDNCQF